MLKGKFLFKKATIVVSVLLLLGLVFYPGGSFLFSEELSEDEVIILYTNDEHGIIENMGRIAYHKQELQEQYKDVLLVSAGDLFGGNPVVDQYRNAGKDLPGQPMLELMNQADYDVLTIGNHEFDYGQKRLQEISEGASFPFLLANVEVDEKAELEKPRGRALVETPSGREICFIGLLQLGKDKIPATHPAYLEGLSFIDPVKSMKQQLSTQKEKDLLVALTHLGYARDQELAHQFSDLDLIIGGHSHRVIRELEEINGVYLTQAGSETKYLGQVKIAYDRGEVADISGELIPVKEIKGTVPAIEKEIDKFQLQMEEELKTVFHTFPESIRGKEALGSLMTDSLKEVHELDIAFQHNGGIRLDSLPHNLRMKDVYELDPFDNSVVVRRMNLEEIGNLIFRSFSSEQGIDLRVAGLKYIVKVNEIGEVTGIVLRDEDGSALEQKQEYEVGMNSYLAESYFTDFPDEREEVFYSHTTAETLIEFLRDFDRKKNYNREKRTGIQIERQKDVSGKRLAVIDFPLTTEGKENEQVSAGSLMANAAKEAVEAEIGTYPSDQLGQDLSLSPGPLYEDILNLFFTSFNYDNTLMKVKMKGKELEKLFMQQARWYEGSYPLQVSEGTEYQVTENGGAIQGVKIYYNGSRIKSNEIYSVAVNSFKFDYYQDEVEIKEYENTGIKEKEALLNYLIKGGTIE
ncbi:MAG: 5'-nucleotidase C-terminal domain-containing protein [Bacillota bacterium]